MPFNSNDFFDAIATVVDSKIKKLEYDKTVEAKIVSTAQKSEGIYKVESQSAIFDAYAHDSNSYYENERVYVMIPKGDYTKQKYIVGRITTQKEDTNTKTFNFKLPFDNFVGLENLVTDDNVMSPVGYNANKPADGSKNDIDNEEFLESIQDASRVYNLEMASLSRGLNYLDSNLDSIKNLLQERCLNESGTHLNNYKYSNTKTYLQWLIERITIYASEDSVALGEDMMANEWNWFKQSYQRDAWLKSGDYETLWTAARSAHDSQRAILQAQYDIAAENARNAVNELFNDEMYSAANHNHLWTWTRQDDKPVIETKLGIGIDFKTLLGNSRPISGDYGLRILITGRTKPSEEHNSEERTEEIYFKTSDMYGNVYAFYEPTVQQKIFDISEFLTLNRIDIYFWQDHNFIDYTNRNIVYQQDGIAVPKNIYLSNLEVKLGLTVDECKTDRVFLYTYDDMYYGQDSLDFDSEYKNTEPTRLLQMAWVHIGAQGPVLINHLDYEPENNTKDTSSLRYWQENGGAQINWYHFEFACAQDTTVLAERQGGLNWKYLSQYSNNNVFTIIVEPDIKKAKDKWRVGVSYNDVPTLSDPLVFTNVDTTVETAAYDTLNEIVFRILHEDFSDRDNIAENGHGNIVEDSTLRDFYVYDINGYAIRNELNRVYSDIDYYLQIWIRNNDTGEYAPMSWDPDAGDVQVTFNWPTGPSMIDNWSEISEREMSYAVLAPTIDSASDEYNNSIKSITRKFHIKNYWQANYNNNTISATVIRRGKTYHPSITFNFGQSSSMGSDYTLTMSQILPENGYIIKNQQFSLEAIVRKKDGTVDDNGKYVFSWELLSPTDVRISQNGSKGWETTDSRGFSGNIIRGYIINDYPPIFKVTVRNAADYPISQTSGFKLVNDVAMAKYLVDSCAERVEFKSDGTVPLSYYGEFSVRRIGSNNEVNDVYPEWQMIQMHRNGNNWEQLSTDAYDFFALKKTEVYNKNLSVNDKTKGIYAPLKSAGVPNTNGPFSLTGTAESTNYFHYGDILELINIEYNDERMEALESGYDVETKYEQAERNKEIKLEKLNTVAGRIISTHSVYKFDPYVKNDAKAATWLWKDSLETDYYTYISFVSLENSNYYFRQAIPFTRNLYSSTLLNSWNGQLFLDDEHNAVMSQMVSAGTKDSNNKFTGVIMGNWASYSDTSLDIPGLYGLKDGGQVFGFKTDGTGFIGKADRGRINFDGNQALISNYNRTCYINLDPIRYHLDGNNIIYDDAKGYSQFFIYSEARKSSSASIVGENALEESTFWAKKYIDDSLKDYFIVDPNNGVLTSGGIIARYGKIGNWLISNSGLYQKSLIKDSNGNPILQSSRYMYLGYPGLSDQEINNAKSNYQDLIDMIEARRADAEEALRASFSLEEFKVVGEYYADIFDLDPLHYWNFGWPYEILINTISDLLDNFDGVDEQHFKRSGTLAQKRQYFRSRLKYYIENETRHGYHFHYSNGIARPMEYKYNTGASTVMYTFLTPMWIIDPYPDDFEMLEEWARTGEYTGNKRRQVYYTNPYPEEEQSEDSPISESINAGQDIDDIFADPNAATNGTNIPDWLEASEYYIVIPSGEDYLIYRAYQDPTNPIQRRINGNGWATYQEMLDAKEAMPVDEYTVAYAKSGYRFYLIENAYYFIPPPLPAPGGGGGGDNYSPGIIPSYSETYYSLLNENDDWEHNRVRFGAKQFSDQELENNPDAYPVKTFVITNTRDTLEYNQLIIVRREAQAAYRYYLEAYNRQLAEALAVGMERLTESQLDDYNRKKLILEQQLQEALIALNEKYDNMLKLVDDKINADLVTLYDADKDRYAIYAGYLSPVDGGSPLFSVNWRGYMTARAGRIGKNNPWYISDNGLTQTISYVDDLTSKKYYGTIFLGNPEAGSDASQWSDDAITDLSDIELLPNDADNRNNAQGPTVLGYSDTDGNPTSGKFAIYAGGNGYLRTYDSILHQFVRSWTNTKTIKFGVRLDGTLYSTWGQIGGWSIADSTLSNYDDSIVLDSIGGQIVLGYGRTILHSNGKISLINTFNNDGTIASTGCIELAGYQLTATTADTPPQVLNSVVNEIDQNAATREVTFTKRNDIGVTFSEDGKTFSIDWKYSKLGVKSYSWSATADQDGKTTVNTAELQNVNTFAIIESAVSNGNENTGLNLVTGYLKNDNTKTGTILYATGTTENYATLGTSTRPWNLFANSIVGGAAKFQSLYLNQNALWLGGEKAATEPWVLNKLKALADLIASSGGGSGGSASQSWGGGNSLSDAMGDALNGVTVLGGESSSFDVNVLPWYDSQTGTSSTDLIITFPLVYWEITVSDDGGNGAKGELKRKQTGASIKFNGEDIPYGGKSNISTDFFQAEASTPLSSAINDLATKTSLRAIDINTLTIDEKPDADNLLNFNFYPICYTAGQSENTVDLSHTHEVEFTEPSGNDGTVTLTIGDADFSKTTSEEATFDVVDTTWYTSQILGIAKGAASTGDSATIKLWNSDRTYSYDKDYVVTLAEDVANKKVTLSNTSHGQLAEVSTAETYKAGYLLATSYLHWGNTSATQDTLYYPTIDSHGAFVPNSSTIEVTMEAGTGAEAGTHKPKATVMGHTAYGTPVGTYDAGWAAAVGERSGNIVTYATSTVGTKKSEEAYVTGGGAGTPGIQTYVDQKSSIHFTNETGKVTISACDEQGQAIKIYVHYKLSVSGGGAGSVAWKNA